MGIRTQCSCGKVQVWADFLEGKDMRCRGCRQRVAVRGEKIPDDQRVSWPRRLMYLAAALVLTGGVLWFITWAAGPHFTPVSEFYEKGSRSPIDPKMDEIRVRIVVEATASAMSEGQSGVFAEHFHFRRLLAEVETRGGLALIRIKRMEDEVLAELEADIRSFCGTEHGAGVTWTPVRRLAIRFLEGRGEAEVTAQFQDGPHPLRYRFWLIKEGEVWSIFDFEELTTSNRYSTSIGRFLRRTASDFMASREDETHWASLDRADALIAKGKPEEALTWLVTIPTASVPAVLAARRDSKFAAALFALERYEEALAAADQSLARQKDVPETLFLRSQILYRLKRYPESIQSGETFLRLVGPDAVACVWIASAWDQLQKPEGAVEVFRRLLSEAPDLARDLEAVDGIEDFQNRPEVAEALKQAKARIPTEPKK